MIEIKSFKAKGGDAFLLSFGEKKEQNIIIDMGFVQTYNDEIEKELENIEKIDLLVVTHVDADHINGVVKLIEQNKDTNSIIKIDEIWHNSYRHLKFDKEKIDVISDDERESLKEMIASNISNNDATKIQDISCEKGSSLAGYLYGYNYNWNTSFDDKAVVVKDFIQKEIGKIKIIIISPTYTKLEELSEYWIDELEEKKYKFNISDEKIFDDAFEFYLKHKRENKIKISTISSEDNFDFEELAKLKEVDKTKTNGASIAFIVEYEDKKLLFLGDAHEDVIYENLTKLKEKTQYKLDFDLVKVSHHGSNGNISNRLLSLISSKRFLISTDGSYNHPDKEAISKIIVANYPKELIFNYDLKIIEKLNNKDFKKKYCYKLSVISNPINEEEEIEEIKKYIEKYNKKVKFLKKVEIV